MNRSFKLGPASRPGRPRNSRSAFFPQPWYVPPLERFLQADHAVLKVEFGHGNERIGRALLDAELTALAVIGPPLHHVFLFVIGPAGVGTADITGETTRAFLVIDHRSEAPPARGAQQC